MIHAENLEAVRALPDGAFQLIYLDPPFNTGRTQERQNLTVTRTPDADPDPEPGDPGAGVGLGSEPDPQPGAPDPDPDPDPDPQPEHPDAAPALAPASTATPEPVRPPGARLGFHGRSYDSVKGMLYGFDDSFADYWDFLEPRLIEAWRLLHPTGTLYLHLDYREVHYAKVVLDALFGRRSFLNEIVWAYDYGAKSRRRWPAKHDTILVYVKDPIRYRFDSEGVDREPYMAPGLVTPEKRERGKLPTDVWWHTIVSPTGREKTGYATQKPLGVLRRIVQASSGPGDWVLDFFAGSGTTGAAARELGRRFVLVDENPQAIEVMRARLDGDGTVFVAPDARPAARKREAPAKGKAPGKTTVTGKATAPAKPKPPLPAAPKPAPPPAAPLSD
ncbi:site-specific DNA-methyltransferase [Clavibacter tessellarius]|uniref:Methyltransferase n=1 Tax=Clavibacter tessellarius TaxID=31965 RepID=A0A225CEX7_9MICO|nr:site-specific DNA-methyltransferase [Clavibacter michiganensis subsp. tessellarius]UKF35430.1 site-specific DNA-methyltransferase [Clavibacter michiganensis subsp. tessellarius]